MLPTIPEALAILKAAGEQVEQRDCRWWITISGGFPKFEAATDTNGLLAHAQWLRSRSTWEEFCQEG